MNKREKEVFQYQLDSEKAVLEELEKQYRVALRDIKEKVQIFESDVYLIESAIRQSDMDATARAAALSVRQSKIYQKKYQEALQKQLEGILDKLQSDEYSTLQKYLHSSYEDAFLGTMYDIHGQGIPLVMPIDQSAAVKAIMTDSQISGGLYASLGVDVKGLKKAISQEITRGIATGMEINEIARNISNVSNAPLSRAKTIARTESHRIQQASTMDAQIKSKDKGADVVKQWDSTLDGATRPVHRHLDGQIREIDEPFEAGGKKAMYPGDFGDPAEDCNCRCVSLTRARWALDEDELQTLKDRAKFFGLDKTEDFNDFKKKYLKASEKPLEKAEKDDTIKVNKSVVKEAIASGEVSTTINADKQNKHIKGSGGFVEGRSYIFGNLEDAQKLVDDLNGTGTPIMAKGKWTHKERVQSQKAIGVHVVKDTGAESETKTAIIVYSKTGSHVYPARGEEE